MKLWIKILEGVLPGATILLLFFFFFFWCRRRRRRQQQLPMIANPSFNEAAAKSRHDSLQAGVAKLHLSHKSTSSKSSLRFHQLHSHREQQHHQHAALQHRPPPPPFNWEDHPRLVSEAVENGLARFAFAVPTGRSHQRSTSPLLAHFCAACDGDEPEINWEVPTGSSEFMQTVRINPKKTGSLKNAASPLHGDDFSNYSIRMSIPLPGPDLGGSSFPQEAYFEITILYLQPLHHKNSRASKRSKDNSISGDSDHVKLIQENSFEAQYDTLAPSTNGSGGTIDVKSPMLAKEENKKHGKPLVSLGLTRGGHPPSRSMPGTYPGSIGFHSNGSVFLDGMKLVLESEKTEWTGVNRVIGCGFNPSKKKVFLTVDTELVHIIHCNSDVYKSPLYPVLAANADVMVLVNLGQRAFEYAPANAQRTPNPCFLRPSPGNNAAAGLIGYEDSRELFSVGRLDGIDATEKNKCSSSSGKKSSSDEDEGSILDGESDLFEIALHS